ncbi:RNA polymerase sigma factor [Sphingomonas sp. GlSt437]|uniref:RNA polymerase sigma factor n=1 Tax=Sphingomonas sp. GlSt437 TaxID=3389970 RepID=UPI003A86F598
MPTPGVTAGLQGTFLAERPRLLRLLRARLGGEEDAEEALQDLWLRLESARPGPVAEPVAYLFRMANNLATDRRRSGLRRGALETAWHEVLPQGHEHPDAERAAIARDWLTHVEATIAAMPERMREAYRLFRLEGLAQRDIARRMSISVSAVEKLLQRAYARLERLEDESDVDD